MTNGPRIRKALEGIPPYRAGQPAPEGAYKLSSNENPFTPLPGVVAAIQDAAAEVNRYPDFTSEQLLVALAERHGVTTGQVVLGTGSVAVLSQTISAVAGSGDEVVVPWRSFEAYPILVQLSGASLVKVALKADHTHDMDSMAAAVTSRTRLIVVCSPNNPTGTVVTEPELRTLIERVPKDVLIAVDEAYVEFVDLDKRLPTLDLVQEHSNVMMLRTFSKAFGLAGVRIGYAITPPQIALALRKAQLPFGVSSIAERAALASLSNEPELVRRVAQLVGERRRVYGALGAAGVVVPEPQGNFVWVPAAGATSALAEFLAKGGVVARAFPGDGVRITIGEPPANDLVVKLTAQFWEQGARR